MNKIPVSFTISRELSDRLTTQADRTGLKKTTIIEQGTESRVKELEEEKNL